MQMIVCGGRAYRLHPRDYERLDVLLLDLPITELIVGDARGVDTDAELWARTMNLPVKVFHADWKTHGRAAGPIRNQQMADYVQLPAACIAFPGGAGTADMVRRARKRGLRMIIQGEINA